MTTDLQSLTARLERDPADALTVQALADWIEEKGGDPGAVRALPLDGPTALLFSYSHDAERYATRDLGEAIAAWLETASGHPVAAFAVPEGLGVRAIRCKPAAPPATA